MSNPLTTERVGDRFLIVKPSQTVTAPVGLNRQPVILSRQEIARRRDANEVARLEMLRVKPATVPVVELAAIDMTPLPKNKGGRPRKD